MAPRRHVPIVSRDQNSAAQAANGSRNAGVSKHRPNEVVVHDEKAGLPSKIFGAVRIARHQCLEGVEYMVDATDSISSKALMLRIIPTLRATQRYAEAHRLFPIIRAAPPPSLI